MTLEEKVKVLDMLKQGQKKTLLLVSLGSMKAQFDQFIVVRGRDSQTG